MSVPSRTTKMAGGHFQIQTIRVSLTVESNRKQNVTRESLRLANISRTPLYRENSARSSVTAQNFRQILNKASGVRTENLENLPAVALESEYVRYLANSFDWVDEWAHDFYL